MKTAVAKHRRENNIPPALPGEDPSSELKDLAASFQASVIDALAGTTEKQAIQLGARTLIVAGGVASNNALREACRAIGKRLDMPVYFPSRHLSTDNAAMIAAAGYFHLKNGDTSGFDMTADVSMRLQNLENPDAELKRRKVRYRL